MTRQCCFRCVMRNLHACVRNKSLFLAWRLEKLLVSRRWQPPRAALAAARPKIRADKQVEKLEYNAQLYHSTRMELAKSKARGSESDEHPHGHEDERFGARVLLTSGRARNWMVRCQGPL